MFQLLDWKELVWMLTVLCTVVSTGVGAFF